MAVITGLIRVMERAARKAGNRLRRDFGEVEHLQVSRKGPADFVSKADMRAERILYDELLNARPDWGFVLEEAGVIEGDPNLPRWIIDPLDGTSNFLHGIPHFAISIAAQEPKPDGSGWGDVIAGVIYQPITDETFWAEKSSGAWLMDARLRVMRRRLERDAEAFVDRAHLRAAACDREIAERSDVRRMLASSFLEGFREGVQGVARSGLLNLRPWDFDPAEIESEVHVWHGDEDRSTPISFAHWLERTLPRANVRIFPGEGHYLALTHWPEALELLLG